MGFFSWLGSLVDQLLEWLGQIFAAFINALVNLLQLIWETAVATVLIAAFGLVSILYVMFYAGAVLGETIMEIWDPASYTTKPSQVFALEQAPQDSPLPTNRSEAKRLKLQNWS
ncbi:MAG: hypothetical protein KA717_11620 [Woronichinia naegeliana WA131]|jgi:hypothetical protein|uniref:Uncharacterized protein n=1 Tax=Woronichinia naegeliana WA131 TaxID=2824559 RepID=A0A977PYE7_9CYAN|nr:MAG: hypothetical protein KA717_11620 [Woronichinia naegeliana WA131]